MKQVEEIDKQKLEFNLEEILKKASTRSRLQKEEVLFLLDLQDLDDINKLFLAARKVRSGSFGNEIFLYGFLYFSTYCRNDCAFCFYRKSNPVSKRYRKTPDEIIETAEKLLESGVHLLDLTMGEDPLYFTTGDFSDLLETVSIVRKRFKLPVMISPGVIPREVLDEFKKIGVEWYACYQETHNRDLYAKMRLAQSYDERYNIKNYAREVGFLIEEGLLAGIGESAEDLYDSFQAMEELQADQVRVMSFIPQKGTPLETHEPMPRLREMLVIAVMRLLFPDRLIPASLDVDGISGLKQRLNAGANVITSLIPPDTGLMGVSQSTLDIQEGGRTVAGTIPILTECGLKPASSQSYRDWVDNRQSSRR